MSNPAAVAGTFTKVESIASRKVARLHIEIPIEQVNVALTTLGGYPDPADPVWVGIARLKDAPAKPEKPKRSFHELPRAQQAGIVCNEPAFARFVEEQDWKGTPEGFVRHWCGVSSRAELNLLDDPEPGKAWDNLYSMYRAWLEAA